MKHRDYSNCIPPKTGTRKIREAFLGLVFLAACLAVLTPRTMGEVKSIDTQLKPLPQGEIPMYWKVLRAGIRQDFTGTTGYLELRNISGAPITNALFYVEYFDSAGRFCFSLVMSQAGDSEAQAGIAPDESRIIGAFASGLFPATEPTEAKISLIQLSSSYQSVPTHRWEAHIRTPVTFSAKSQGYLQLSLLPATIVESPVLDLLLADVRLDSGGSITEVNVLNKADSEVESWFRQFVRQDAVFYPVTESGHPQDSRALILVRAVPPEASIEGVPIPEASPWVKSYLRALNGESVPPLTSLVLTRPATQINKLTPTGQTQTVNKAPAPAGLFQLASQDTYWSSPASRWVHDPTMPHRLRREFANVQAN